MVQVSVLLFVHGRCFVARVHPYTISFISAGLLHHDLQSSLVTIMSYIYIYIYPIQILGLFGV